MLPNDNFAGAIDDPRRAEQMRLSCYVSSETGCWVWTKHIQVWGYGSASYKRRMYQAHRLMYQLTVGAIPAGLTLDHLCRNRACINPAHLEPVTQAENRRRAAALITHCPNGHEYTRANTQRTSGRNRRACRTCQHAAAKRWAARQKVGSQ